ncbi:hypothetical protein U9M48_035389 [Paspalum notatum var. saurae]|uniref:AP-2 complex subunit sigma n=1 Tax=Paspalum notatum var. saurae TaxID=547442 RepID=A0AAQ3UFC3_PASNO
MIRFILLQNRQGKTRLAKYYVPLEDSEKHKVEYEVSTVVEKKDLILVPVCGSIFDLGVADSVMVFLGCFESRCIGSWSTGTPSSPTSSRWVVRPLDLDPRFGSVISPYSDTSQDHYNGIALSKLFSFVVPPVANVELLLQFRTHKVIYRRYAGLFFSMCVDITDNELAYLECIHLFVEILDHFFSNVCELDLVFNFHKVYLILDEFILAGELQETSKRAIIERMGELEKLE